MDIHTKRNLELTESLRLKSRNFSFLHSLELIYNLDSSFSSSFAVITQNKIKVIKWGSYKSKEYKSDYALSILKPSNNGYIAVFNRQSDKTDNKIAFLSKNGKVKYELAYIGSITDIDVIGSNVHCMSDTEISVVYKDGKLTHKSNFGFGGVNILTVSSSSVLVVTDNKIEKIKLSKG